MMKNTQSLATLTQSLLPMSIGCVLGLAACAQTPPPVTATSPATPAPATSAATATAAPVTSKAAQTDPSEIGRTTFDPSLGINLDSMSRSEERRVGKEC